MPKRWYGKSSPSWMGWSAVWQGCKKKGNSCRRQPSWTRPWRSLPRRKKASLQHRPRKSGAWDQERAAKQAVARVEQQIREGSRGLPYLRAEEAYEEALDAAESYQALLGALGGQLQRLDPYSRRSRSGRGTASPNSGTRQMCKTEALRKPKNSWSCPGRGCRPSRNSWTARRTGPGAQRRAALNQELEAQRLRMNEAEKRCAALEVERRAKGEQLRQRNELLSGAVLEEDELKRYFQEDLGLNLCPLSQGTLEQCAGEAWEKVRPEDRERTPERMGDALRNNYLQHNNSLLKYQPKIQLVFEDAAKPGWLRQRLCISLQWEGKDLSLYGFFQELQKKIDMTAALLEEKDRDLFENIWRRRSAINCGHALRRASSGRNMTSLMGTLKTSMGLTFRLEWKAKKAEGEFQLDTEQLVRLLNKDRALLTREDSQRVSLHFRAKVKQARQEAVLQEKMTSYADLIRDVLDYRDWYEFHLLYQRNGDPRKRADRPRL